MQIHFDGANSYPALFGVIALPQDAPSFRMCNNPADVRKIQSMLNEILKAGKMYLSPFAAPIPENGVNDGGYFVQLLRKFQEKA